MTAVTNLGDILGWVVKLAKFVLKTPGLGPRSESRVRAREVGWGRARLRVGCGIGLIILTGECNFGYFGFLTLVGSLLRQLHHFPRIDCRVDCLYVLPHRQPPYHLEEIHGASRTG